MGVGLGADVGVLITAALATHDDKCWRRALVVVLSSDPVGTQQINAATGQLSVMQSDAITPVQPVPQSLAAILSERKNRARLGLSKYAAEAAERAGESDGNLALSRNVRDVAAVHSTLWPAETQTGVFNAVSIAVLTGQIQLQDSPGR